MFMHLHTHTPMNHCNKSIHIRIYRDEDIDVTMHIHRFFFVYNTQTQKHVTFTKPWSCDHCRTPVMWLSQNPDHMTGIEPQSGDSWNPIHVIDLAPHSCDCVRVKMKKALFSVNSFCLPHSIRRKWIKTKTDEDPNQIKH